MFPLVVQPCQLLALQRSLQWHSLWVAGPGTAFPTPPRPTPTASTTHPQGPFWVFPASSTQACRAHPTQLSLPRPCVSPAQGTVQELRSHHRGDEGPCREAREWPLPHLTAAPAACQCACPAARLTPSKRLQAEAAPDTAAAFPVSPPPPHSAPPGLARQG